MDRVKLKALLLRAFHEGAIGLANDRKLGV